MTSSFKYTSNWDVESSCTHDKHRPETKNYRGTTGSERRAQNSSPITIALEKRLSEDRSYSYYMTALAVF